MARGRSRVEKGSDIHAPHPFLVFFFSYLFSFLGGLEPTHTPRWLCSQVDMPHVECKDQDPQDLPALGESKERQQGEESREDEAGRGSASANRQLMMLEGKSGSYFSSLDSSIDILKKRAQELIENINESRQKDHALMTNFRDSLKIKVSDLTEKLEERMYQIYNHHNKIIQDKLQEFTQKMAKISHLETELKQVCHTVETVYKDLCIQPEATTSEEQAHKDGEF
ncbi:synaptonemal complex central element protein 2 isoform X3 [Mustela lutreola]|uniref:synaptonemal complex central element protein 2 isoform X3 n=1 Tax=Mustela lutreola TaxID=9666 RepID=UPI002796E995|nr:synaptonemal complex central element protein 2 isoform X3 [Mustela lutreola]